MRFGSVFLWQKLGFFQKLHFFLFGFPNLGAFVRKRNIDTLLAMHKLNPEKLLDVGCGLGEFSFFLAEKFKHSEILGIDKSLEKQMLEGFAKKNGFGNISFLERNFFKFGQNGFDFVFSIEVFEHFESLTKAVKKTASLMKRGGFFLIHVPSRQWEKFDFFGKENFPNYLKFVEREHVSRGITLGSLSAELEKNGFKIIFSKKTFGTIARLCWETDLFLMEKKLFLLRALLLPFFKAFSFFDPYFRNENGRGILILAQKVKG